MQYGFVLKQKKKRLQFYCRKGKNYHLMRFFSTAKEGRSFYRSIQQNKKKSHKAFSCKILWNTFVYVPIMTNPPNSKFMFEFLEKKNCFVDCRHWTHKKFLISSSLHTLKNTSQNLIIFIGSGCHQLLFFYFSYSVLVDSFILFDFVLFLSNIWL